MAVLARTSTATSGAAGLNPTLVINSAVVAGDILVLAITNRGAVTSPTVTDDDTGGNTWTLLKNQDADTNGSVWVYWKRATSGTASKTITLTGCTNSGAAVVTPFYNVSRDANPFTRTTPVSEANASGNETQAEIVVGQANSMVILVVGCTSNDTLNVATPAATDPSSLTEAAEGVSTTGSDCSVSLNYAIKTSAGGTGAFTWTQTDGTGASIAFALEPLGITLSETATTSHPVLEPGFNVYKNGERSKTLSETSTLGHNVLNLAGIVLLEALSLTDPTVVTSQPKAVTLTETATLSDTYSRVRTAARTLTETATPSDSIQKATARNWPESLTIGDTVLNGHSEIYIESVALTDSLVLGRTAARTLTEGTTLSDVIRRDATRALAETITPEDTLTIRRDAARILAETITPEDTLTTEKSGTKTFDGTETVTLGHNVLNLAGIILTESAALSDSVQHAASKTLSEALVIGLDPVTWTSDFNVAVDGNRITKTFGSSSYDAGAISTEQLAAGNGRATFVTSVPQSDVIFGLGNGNTNQGYADIEFGLLVGSGSTNGVIRVYEGGSLIGGDRGNYKVGDTLTVAVEGGAVKYYQNSTLLYTSLVSPSYPLVVDSSLYYTGTWLEAWVDFGVPGRLDLGTSRELSETATLADDLTATKGTTEHSTSPVETATLTDALVMGINAARTLAETATLTDQVSKGVSRVVTETSTLADALILGRAAARTLTETATLADSLFRSAGVVLTESATLSDAQVTLGRTAARTLTEAITPEDTLTTQKSGGANPSETVTLTDALTLGVAAARTLTETATLADVLEASKNASNYTKELTETATLADATLNLAGIVLWETVSLSDTCVTPGRYTQELTETATLTDPAVVTDQTPDHYTKELTETATLTDPELEIGVVPGEALTLTDILTATKSGGVNPTETATLADSLVLGRTAARTLIETATISDDLLSGAGQAFTESVTLADSLTLGRAAARELLETATLSDSILRGTARLLTETLTPADSCVLGRTAARELTETVTLTDLAVGTSHTHSGASSVTPTDTLNLSDSLTLGRTAARTLTETTSLSDGLLKGTSRALLESAGLTDSQTEGPGKDAAEPVSLTDATRKDIGRQLSESAALADEQSKGTGREWADSLTLADTVTAIPYTPTTYAKTLTETLTLTDLAPDLARILIEIIGLLARYDPAIGLLARVDTNISLRGQTP